MQTTALETRFKPPAHLAVATVLIIGASRGIGLEAVKAAPRGGTFGACADAVSPKNSY
jgi:NAD(P)-dependent dehydrogenase (short-subunit alcohol dehydrogenase family)